MFFRGVSLYLTLVILSVLTVALLALVNLSVSQIRIISTAGNSVAAFFAADTGIEYSLYRVRKEDNLESFSGVLGESSYDVVISITSATTTIQSIGGFRNTRRAIEAKY